MESNRQLITAKWPGLHCAFFSVLDLSPLEGWDRRYRKVTAVGFVTCRSSPSLFLSCDRHDKGLMAPDLPLLLGVAASNFPPLLGSPA